MSFGLAQQSSSYPACRNLLTLRNATHSSGSESDISLWFQSLTFIADMLVLGALEEKWFSRSSLELIVTDKRTHAERMDYKPL